MLKAATLALFTITVAAAAPALAEPAREKVVVSYADLDLTQEADRQVLRARVREAANKVCGYDTGREFRDVVDCRFHATREVIETSDGLVRAALENSPAEPTRIATR